MKTEVHDDEGPINTPGRWQVFSKLLIEPQLSGNSVEILGTSTSDRRSVWIRKSTLENPVVLASDTQSHLLQPFLLLSSSSGRCFHGLPTLTLPCQSLLLPSEP